MLAETIPCDVTLRQLQRVAGSKGSKSFDLSRMHSLPPRVVTLFCETANGMLVPYKADLGSTLTDEQQHAISSWRNAAFDRAGAPLVLDTGGRKDALLSRIKSLAEQRGESVSATVGRAALPSSLTKLQERYRQDQSALRPTPMAQAAPPGVAKRKRPPQAAAAGAPPPVLALRIHCDVNDAQSLPGAHIQSDSTDDSVLGGELVLDGFAGEEWEELAQRRAHPSLAVTSP